MSYRGYLLKMDIAMRARTTRSKIAFDAANGTWTLGERLVRTTETDGEVIRFRLFTTAAAETLVGSYSGTIGTTPDEVAQYLVYFLESGKPWHQGLSNRGIG
jgi:spore coat protein U-like protein